MNKKQRNNLIRILLVAAMLIALHFVTLGRPVMLALYLVPYLVVGYDILRKAYKGIVNRQPLDENLLMAIATIGALALAVYRTGDFTEAVAVMLFYQVGELFQSYAVGRSRRNIGELMDIRPDYANIEGPEGIEQVDPDEVEIGTVILVQPGEKIPIDGIIEEGSASIDTSALTGESVPRTVHAGDSVLSGCINTNGLLWIRTTQEFDESTASKILDLVENASSRKSRSENFISRFARIYTPVVVLCAVALAIIPPLLCLAVPGLAELSVMGGGVPGTGVDAGLAGAGAGTDPGLAGAGSGLAGVNPAAAGMGQIWSVWIYRALTFLVVSCPCALVISIPLSFFAGIGGASREGILIKGSNFLEGMSQVKTVVMDKTGTLTKGVFEVTGVYPAGGSRGEECETEGAGECGSDLAGPGAAGAQPDGASGYTAEEILHLAAHAERHSSHPIALALRKAYGEEATDGCSVDDVEEIAGHGIRAHVDGHVICVGNKKMMALAAGDGANAEGLEPGETVTDLTASETAADLAAGAGTVIHVSVDGNYAGAIVIADVIKENSAAAIERMKSAGVSRTVMLTGDMKSAAEAVGQKLGITEIRSELLPEDKVSAVEGLLKEIGADEHNDNSRQPRLAFVGDGINDAPVLARADIGIAMGALGSDAAIEAADIVLMDDDPLKISKAIRISRKCMRIVHENIWFAIGIKVLCLLLCAIGLVGMWAAIFADVGVMVLAVLNAMRTLFVKKL